jgi:hypothetical protein
MLVVAPESALALAAALVGAVRELGQSGGFDDEQPRIAALVCGRAVII